MQEAQTKAHPPAQDEMLLTLMRLKMNLLEEDLAIHFGISHASVCSILTMWILDWSLELEPLIQWPTAEEVKQHYPECLRKNLGQ